MPMPRGVSIVPRQSGRNKYEVPADLKSTFFDSPTGLADERSEAPNYISVFDEEGNLTARQVGVHTFRFRRSALFYYVRSQNWVTLLSLSISIYLMIVAVVAVMYYIWGNFCGAADSVNVIGAVYFTVVSLAANGGYLGEDDDTMTNPYNLCYHGRTIIVMACSYVNILFVGIVAALVVSKAESTTKLGNRIVFSTYCALAPVPGRPDQWKLTFRIANVENMKPIANGRLRLFCLSMQPMSEYKMEQREQRKLLHYMRRARKAASSAELSGTGAVAVAERLTNDLLRRKRLAALEPSGTGGRRAAAKASAALNVASAAAAVAAAATTTATVSSPARAAEGGGSGEELANASFTLQDPMVRTLLEYKRRQRSEKNARAEKRRGRKAEAAAKAEHESVSAERGRRGDHLSGDFAPPVQGTTAVAIAGEEASDVEATVRPSFPDSRTAAAGPRRAASAGSSLSTTASSSSSSELDGVQSDRTNSSFSERPVFSPVTGSPSQHLPSYGTLPRATSGSVLSRSAAAAATGSVSGRRHKGYVHLGHQHDGDEWEDVLPKSDDADWERVFITSQELRWSCAGESYLDGNASGQLGLWYPAAITHHIDERSPLFRFMDVQRLGVGMLQEMVFGPNLAAEVRRQKQRDDEDGGAGVGSDSGKKPARPAKRFQLVAVFEATEIETGATITAKHTYDTSEVIANSKFSNKLTRMHKKTKEVWLDYHYFNDVLPLLATDSSTTDSED